MKLITISTYDRDDYLNLVLSHLVKCFGIKDYQIHVCVDKSQVPQPKIVSTLRYYQRLLNLTYEMNKKRLDCSGNIFKCLSYGFEKTDFLIHVEDDIILAKDSLLFFEYCKEKYKDDKDIFSVSCYNRYTSRDYKPTGLEIIHRKPEFDPWGWGTWTDRWEEMKVDWQFGYDARYKNGVMVLPPGHPWGVNTNEVIRGDRSRIFPECARSKNIGVERGRHTIDKKQHVLDHNIKYWANDFDLNDGIIFKEQPCLIQT